MKDQPYLNQTTADATTIDDALTEIGHLGLHECRLGLASALTCEIVSLEQMNLILAMLRRLRA